VQGDQSIRTGLPALSKKSCSQCSEKALETSKEKDYIAEKEFREIREAQDPNSLVAQEINRWGIESNNYISFAILGLG
jgi:hypothetical protein